MSSVPLQITLYAPHPMQQRAHDDEHRFRVLNWGRRTGKSVFALNECVLKASTSVGRYWIVAPTYRQVKSIYWDGLLKNSPQRGGIPKELISKTNESELKIFLINGSVIELKGADNEDSLRGAELNGVVLDEYAFIKPTVWTKIIRPMLVTTQGWAIFISTPNGFNHFYDQVNYALNRPDWAYIHATFYDNPYIPDAERESTKQDYYAKGDDGIVQFEQEYMGEFKKMTGLVYKNFDRNTHVVAPDSIPQEGTRMISIDFGFANPTAVLFVLADYDDNWYVYDEIYKSGMISQQTGETMLNKMGQRHFSYMIGDSAQAQEIANLNAYFASKDIRLQIDPIKKEKDAISGGIKLIVDRLKVQGNGKPRLYVSSECTSLIEEFETYRYPEKRDNKNESEDPIKENDHALDALRYLILVADQPMPTEEFPEDDLFTDGGFY